MLPPHLSYTPEEGRRRVEPKTKIKDGFMGFCTKPMSLLIWLWSLTDTLIYLICSVFVLCLGIAVLVMIVAMLIGIGGGSLTP